MSVLGHLYVENHLLPLMSCKGVPESYCAPGLTGSIRWETSSRDTVLGLLDSITTYTE